MVSQTKSRKIPTPNNITALDKVSEDNLPSTYNADAHDSDLREILRELTTAAWCLALLISCKRQQLLIATVGGAPTLPGGGPPTAAEKARARKKLAKFQFRKLCAWNSMGKLKVWTMLPPTCLASPHPIHLLLYAP